jgi:hypothetical protein
MMSAAAAAVSTTRDATDRGEAAAGTLPDVIPALREWAAGSGVFRALLLLPWVTAGGSDG